MILSEVLVICKCECAEKRADDFMEIKIPHLFRVKWHKMISVLKATLDFVLK